MIDPLFYTKTRIAPTPSGYLHLGNIISFLITSAIARKHKAKIFLRIDDLDRARVRDIYINDIFETLNFLEITYDEGPKDITDFKSNYSQIHRLDLYEKALKDLADKGACFACICSRKILAGTGGSSEYSGHCKQLDIPLTKRGCCWRFRTNLNKQVPVRIYPNHFITTPFPSEMKDFIIRKKDMYPSYQLASVVDDVYYGADLIVRGADLWHSTLAQIHLAANLKEGQPFLKTAFHHHLLVTDGGKKLSKSSGSTSIQYLRSNGAKKTDIYKLIGEYLKFSVAATTLDDFCELYFRDISQQ